MQNSENKNGESLDLEKSKSSAPISIDSGWGAADVLSQNDLLVSKLYHQQAQSKLAKDLKASPGDFCDSISGEIICKRETPLSVIIFGCHVNLLISKFNEQKEKYEWIKTVDITPENANFEYKVETREGKFRNQIQYNYFCMLTARPDDLPYVLSMTSTKVKTAKRLNTLLAKLKKIGKPSAAYVFDFVNVKEAKDNDTWWGLDVIQSRATTPEELKTAFAWYQAMATSRLKVMDAQGSEEEQFQTGEDGDIPF
jgi:hypothetical protein